jgi:hypothetical protein
MITQQLSVMVRNLRAECGHSLSVAQGVNSVETLKYLLARTQEELWTAFIWPELKIRAAVSLAPGQYSYPYPTVIYPSPTAMSYDCIRETWTAPAGSAAGTHWTPVEYGIPDEDMILPDDSNSERNDPARYWDVFDNTNFRIWPTPNTATKLRFIGQEPLGAFTADSDVSTLDATCIVLFASADLLARAKAEDAAGKMQKAQRHLTKLLGNKVSSKMKVATLGGGSPNRNTQRGNILFGRGF